MYLYKLKLSNFKNIAEAELSFCPNLNCFVGENGVGKTNILDSIHYLSFCKSYFNTIDANNIKYEKDFFAIHGNYNVSDGEGMERYSCIQKKGERKQFKAQEKEYSKLSKHIGKIPLVIITPLDQELIIGGSDLRRKFLDSVISQADTIYMDSLIKYNKALQQRNQLLKQFSQNNSFDNISLEIWNNQLNQYGSDINRKRRIFIKFFSPLFQYYYTFITSDKEKVSIDYLSENYEENFLSLLENSIQKDRMLNYTSVGVHKDDLELKMNSYAVKKYASQGQQKSFLLALKLAQFEYLFNQTQIKPILLLDDVFDKLDLNRINKLIELVGSDRFGQVFITDTQIGRVESIFKDTNIEHRIYRITEKGIE